MFFAKTDLKGIGAIKKINIPSHPTREKNKILIV